MDKWHRLLDAALAQVRTRFIGFASVFEGIAVHRSGGNLYVTYDINNQSFRLF